MVTINQLSEMVVDIVGVKLEIKHVPGPPGVGGRNSDNRLIMEKFGCKPNMPLREGLKITINGLKKRLKGIYVYRLYRFFIFRIHYINSFYKLFKKLKKRCYPV